MVSHIALDVPRERTVRGQRKRDNSENTENRGCMEPPLLRSKEGRRRVGRRSKSSNSRSTFILYTWEFDYHVKFLCLVA